MIDARLAAFFAQFCIGCYALARQRSWKALGIFLGTFGFFMIVLRYFICAMCSNYGQDCYSLRIGKFTSKLYKYRPGEFSLVAVVLEALTLGVVAFTPAVALRKNRSMWLIYSFFNAITLGTQFFHACRHCAENARPDWGWRYKCPAAVTYRALFGIEPKGA